ncbi:MAG TPA: formyltransferase family protein [Geminicoccus sp.]|jgi:methionyl-tRNA formyltransferase|uniref:methionyl-tRNA formyltransferase n=1 Tax=Geminicoccus sp. TaxID=2024832 RepID=UPI002E37244C|nr:formyltransferase family protein [Geminicoccus sp.]HEX2528207.1 formyltransferase family protein [Geminicoccus sp.]
MASPVRLRVLFIGTNSIFSLGHLQVLAPRHDVVAILRSVRRSHGLAGLMNRFGPSTLGSFAKRHGIPFAQADRSQLEIVRTLCDRHGAEIVCVASMTCLLPADLLGHPRLGFLNVHPAKLPEWRGPFPIFWQLLTGRGSIGVTVHRLQAGEDDGPILLQGEVPVQSGARHADLALQVAREGGRLLLDCLDQVIDRTAVAAPQPATSPTTRARKVGPADAGLVFQPDWPIERCAARTAMLGGLVAFPRPRLRDLGWLAQASGEWRCGPDPSVRPGAVGKDAQTWFLAHPAGKLELDRSWQPRVWAEALRACRRAGIGWSELI